MAETFETLKARIGEWLGVDTTRLPDSARGTCVNLIQRRLLRQYDLRFGELPSTLPLITGTRTYALPTGWRAPLNLWYINPNTSAKVNLSRIQKDAFDDRFPEPTDTGNPSHYTVWANLIYLGPTPDQTITLNLNYYRFLPDLADGSPDNTNDFIVQAWDVLFYGALEEASKYLLEDPRAPMWAAKFMELATDLDAEHQRERSSGRIPQSQEPG